MIITENPRFAGAEGPLPHIHHERNATRERHQSQKVPGMFVPDPAGTEGSFRSRHKSHSLPAKSRREKIELQFNLTFAVFKDCEVRESPTF